MLAVTHPSPPSKVFFAYASQPPLRAETMREAVTATRNRGIDAFGWESMLIGGRVLVDTITDSLRASDACVAEVSSFNANVLFEAGYALARGKQLFFALDETDQSANAAWREFEMIETIGRIDYGGNSERLAQSLSEHLSQPLVPLVEAMLTGGRPREANAIFSPSVPISFNAAERLQALLNRRTDLKVIASNDDLGLSQLSHYTKDIYRSSAAIFHLLASNRVGAATYNARASLLAGIAHGFDLPVKLVAESGYRCALDYRDLFFAYATTEQLTRHVDQWLSALPSPKGSNKRLGRLKLDIELPLRSFGQFVAEAERDELTNYFIHTNEFEAVLSGRSQVFTGRKGTGKSATMLQALEELRKDRRVLVVPVKPSSYDLGALVRIVSSFDESSSRDHFLVNLWHYLLMSEIALRVVAHGEDQPAGILGDPRVEALAHELDSLGIDRSADMSTRLDNILESLPLTGADGLAAAAGRLRQVWGGRVQEKLRVALQAYSRVAVLIDNLDKTWERGVNFAVLSHFLLSLLVTAGKLESEFARQKNHQPAVKVSLTTFLRTDIYDVATQYAREPDKISPQQIEWRDEELLVRVLEERYAANLDLKHHGALDMWTELFCDEVLGLSAHDYILWRVLPRPRDVIYLANAALTTAINRRHDKVMATDFTFAERDYSRFAVEALLVESQPQGFDLEEVLYGFAGLGATLSEGELFEVLRGSPDQEAVRDWLLRTSFLGTQSADGHYVYVEGEAEARKKIVAARRISDRRGEPVMFRVHPAFRPYLDIRDDDLATASGEI